MDAYAYAPLHAGDQRFETPRHVVLLRFLEVGSSSTSDTLAAELQALGLKIEREFERYRVRTTVEEIAERAGLTERTFFRYFVDKREVLFSGSKELDRRSGGADDAPKEEFSTPRVAGYGVARTPTRCMSPPHRYVVGCAHPGSPRRRPYCIPVASFFTAAALTALLIASESSR